MNNLDLLKKYGTPLYHFDILDLKNRVEMMKEEQSDIGLCYAMKAGPALAKYIAPYVDRLEVCSPGEYEICVRSGIKPEQILVSGVNKTRESMTKILSYGGAKGCFSIESIEQYEILRDVAKEETRTEKLRCFVRLSSGNQFGVDKKVFEELCDKIISSDYLELVGIHYFSGTQKTLKKIETELAELAEYGFVLEEKFGFKFDLEYGPGLGIDYFLSDKNMEEITYRFGESSLKELMEIVERTRIRNSYSVITFEYGRYIAATCGKYFTGVADVKTNDGTNFAILDGGLHQITYYGSMAGMKVPYIDYISMKNDDSGSEKEKKDYVLAGSLCSVNDILVRKISLPQLDIGDALCFNLAGAYSVTEGIALFLSRDLPAIVVRDEAGEDRLVREHTEINTFNGGYNG